LGAFAPPLDHGRIATYLQAETVDEGIDPATLQQLAHARLLRAGQIEEAIEHCAHQFQPLLQWHRAQYRTIGRATGQAKCQPVALLQAQCRKPQVVRVIEHRHAFTPIELHGELGRQLMEARRALQQVEDLPGQGAYIQQHRRIMASQGAEHQVAHVIAGCITRTKAGGQQAVDQPGMIAADAADLQVTAVGGFDHPARKTLGCRRHRIGLVGQQQAAGQLDTANATVTGADDAPQPRAGRGTG